jgi:hypothetical protein
MDIDEEPLTPAAGLAMIDAEQRRVSRRARVNPAVVDGGWAFAWLVGFGTAYLAYGPDRLVPDWLGPTVPIVLILTALALSFGYAIRVSAGITGPSRRSAATYRWTWTLGFAGLVVVNTALVRHGLPDHTAILLWSGSALLLTGVLQLSGGALWRSRMMSATGVWTIVSAAGAVLAGVPGNFLVLSLAGGGGFALLSVWTAYHSHR